MQEWIAVIDAAIEGVPEQVHKRRQTVNKVFAMRYKDKVQCTCMCLSLIMFLLPLFPFILCMEYLKRHFCLTYLLSVFSSTISVALFRFFSLSFSLFLHLLYFLV